MLHWMRNVMAATLVIIALIPVVTQRSASASTGSCGPYMTLGFTKTSVKDSNNNAIGSIVTQMQGCSTTTWVRAEASNSTWFAYIMGCINDITSTCSCSCLEFVPNGIVDSSGLTYFIGFAWSQGYVNNYSASTPRV